MHAARVQLMGVTRPALLLSLFAALGFVACRGPRDATRQYPLRGQIIAIKTNPTVGGIEITVKHEDIPGFMPGMTMGYFLKKGQNTGTAAPGDLFTATLVVNGGDLYVQDLRVTGHAPLPADAKAVKIMDVMSPGDEVPDDPLVDQTGTARKLSDWRGRAVAVTFVYTRCPVPDFCPLMDRQFSRLQRSIAADPALRDRVHLASISFDPAHDTLGVVREHAEDRGADPRVWSYLTGGAAAIDHLTSRFGVSTIQDKDGADTITHNLRTAVIDPRGRLVKIYSGNEWTPDALLDDLKEALRR
jgi:protein SCO1/2